jgi:hypothetical protein
VRATTSSSRGFWLRPRPTGVPRRSSSLRALIAEKEPSRHGRLAVRRLRRYLQERDPTIDEIALVVGSLVALPGPGRRAALSALRDLA